MVNVFLYALKAQSREILTAIWGHLDRAGRSLNSKCHQGKYVCLAVLAR